MREAAVVEVLFDSFVLERLLNLVVLMARCAPAPQASTSNMLLLLRYSNLHFCVSQQNLCDPERDSQWLSAHEDIVCSANS